MTDLEAKQRESRAARDALLREMRARAHGPKPTPPAPQACSSVEGDRRRQRANSVPVPAHYLKRGQPCEPWRSFIIPGESW
jgi:hypothetical protein